MKTFIFLDEAGFNLRHGGEVESPAVESPAVERGPERCSLGGLTPPPLKVILRGPTAKLVQRAHNS